MRISSINPRDFDKRLESSTASSATMIPNHHDLNVISNWPRTFKAWLPPVPFISEGLRRIKRTLLSKSLIGETPIVPLAQCRNRSRGHAPVRRIENQHNPFHRRP